MEPGAVTLQALAQVMTSVGLSSTLVLFFIWQSWKREERMAVEAQKREEQWETREAKVVERLQHLEDFTRTTLISLNEKTSTALAQNTTVLEKTAEATSVCMVAVNGIAADLKTHHALAVEIAKSMPRKSDE